MNGRLRKNECKVNAGTGDRGAFLCHHMRVMRGLTIKLAVVLGCAVLLAGCGGAPRLKEYGPAPTDPQANYIVIEKSKRQMTLYRNDKPWRSYQVALGQGGSAPKQQEGDKLTPEGLYYIKNRNPQSIYHKSLRVSYPNPEDTLRAKKMGVQPGGHIMIHGLPNGKGRVGVRHRNKDWTEGCIAVTNEEIEQIWNTVADGTPVEIRS